MEERELITVGFGNFSNLVAAQWANGTSQYDVHHKTLYYERRRGGVGRSETQPGGSRALRLLLLDAPHVTYLISLSEAERSAEAESEISKEDPHNSSFSRRHPMRIACDVDLTKEEARLERIAHFMQRRYGRPRSSEENDDEEGEEGHSSSRSADSDDETPDEFYYSTKNVDFSGNPGSPAYHDPSAQSLASPNEPPRKKHDSELHPGRLKSPQKHSARLFRTKDPLASWWKYITAGVDPGNFTTLRPFHASAPVSEVAAIHSFGYGLAHVKSEALQEAQGLAENLRRQLEDADHLQGLQCFVDGDSLFGGAAHNTLREFWEDVGPKVPVALFSIFTPLPPEIQPRQGKDSSPERRSFSPSMANPGGLSMSTVPFANRRVGEACLNRLLSTSLLSEPGSALYIPIEMGHWPSFFSTNSNGIAPEGSLMNASCWWIEEDAAAAQYLAAAIDTALYGTRDGGLADAVDAREEAIGDEKRKGPAYYLGEWSKTLRPSPSYRVSALFASLPLPVDPRSNPQHSGELWSFLESTPLLGLSESGGVSHGRGFIPLSHGMPYSPLSTAGRVLGHSLTLRGAGVLPSRVYSPAEAILRYALPLRNSAYLPLLTRSNYPVSGTFPRELLFDSKEEYIAANKILRQGASSSSSQALANETSNPRGTLAERFDSVDVGSHVITTFNSAPMLDGVVREAQKALRYNMNTYCTSYWMEEEDWKERIEDVLEMRDDYRHDEVGNGDSDSED